MKKIFLSILISCLVFISILLGLIFYPRSLPQGGYVIQVNKGYGLSNISSQLQQDNIIYNRYVFMLTAYWTGLYKTHLHKGNYFLKDQQYSTWDILQRLSSNYPDSITIRLAEGATFKTIQNMIRGNVDVSSNIPALTEEKILKEIGAKDHQIKIEGLLFPDTYEFTTGINEIEIYRLAYKTMQKKLNHVWETRDKTLPYQSPYEMLIMGSMIEKETGHNMDRRKVASVFVNRLRIKMRLQSDPTVIYGLGEHYQGSLRKADLQTDTMYNTYTRSGLPPTPIAMPSLASLQAAAHPEKTEYFYFVSLNDGSGKSYFSKDLPEHNAAVRRYILKR